MKQHPEVYYRDCNDCLLHVYNDETGKRELHRDQPIPRPPGVPALCRKPQGDCPKGTPEEPKTLSERNQKAYRFHQMCCLTGRWPHDDLVVSRGILLKDIEESLKQQDELRRLSNAMNMGVARHG